MQPSVVLVVVIVLAVLVVGVAVARAASGSGSPPPSVGEVPEDTMFQIRQLLGEGKKIQAIKVFRESQPGMGLKEAKEMVEAIEGGYEPPVTAAEPQPQPQVPPAQSDLAARARELRNSGQETLAIRLVCDETGMGILDAQKFVQSLD